MPEITTSDNIIVVLVSLVILETSILFANWIGNRVKGQNDDVNSRFYGFDHSDYIQLILAIIFLVATLYFVSAAVIPLYFAVLKDMNSFGVPAALPYISITVAFVAISFTLLITGLNNFAKTFDTVRLRNQNTALNKRLQDIEESLKRIEMSQLNRD